MPKYNLDEIATRAMLDRNFIPGFPPAVQKETDRIKPFPIPVPNLEAKDLRKLLFFSIDNDDSKDLDQLTYAEDIGNGHYRLYIAVALVDSLVKQDSPIDNRAENNTTSVYTPTKIFPMLPEKLSTDLTSLNPHVDRVAMIFEGVYEPCNNLISYSVYIGYVHNYAQLAYDSLSAWLDGQGPMPTGIQNVPGLEDQIRLQDKIAEQLAECRSKAGQLSLETIELKTIVSDGEPVKLVESKPNRGKKLIEHFMIFANMISAQYSNDNKILSLRRVVVTPKRWDKIVEVAKEKGTILPENPNSLALDKFLVEQRQKEPETFPDLSLTIIKLLGRGEYRVAIPGQKSEGHFGLALREYSHSTAPNRRYPDLITQRLILAKLFNQSSPYDLKKLEALAAHCTQKEDDADKVERRMRKSAAALVLSDSIGKEFNAIVTGVGARGNWIRIFNPPVEGKLVQVNRPIDVGDHIKVKLVFTDVENGFIDFKAS